MPGVDSVPQLVLTVDDDERPECRDVSIATIAANGLLQLTGLDIQTLTLREAAEAEA